MVYSEKLVKLFPATLDGDALAALLKLSLQFNSKEDILKIDNNELESLFEFGRDKNDQILTKLVDLKMISRKQLRNEKGQFTYNEIRITTELIKW